MEPFYRHRFLAAAAIANKSITWIRSLFQPKRKRMDSDPCHINSHVSKLKCSEPLWWNACVTLLPPIILIGVHKASGCFHEETARSWWKVYESLVNNVGALVANTIQHKGHNFSRRVIHATFMFVRGCDILAVNSSNNITIYVFEIKTRQTMQNRTIALRQGVPVEHGFFFVKMWVNVLPDSYANSSRTLTLRPVACWR